MVFAQSTGIPEQTQDYFKYSADTDKYSSGKNNIELTADMMIDSESVSEGQIDSEDVLMTSDEGFAEYAFDVTTAGKYVLFIRYFPIEGKSSSIERSLTLDGEVPFTEAQSIVLTRSWKDGTEYNDGFVLDNKGNELRPNQVESVEEMSAFIYDKTGHYNKPYEFYLSSGRHTLRLTSVREPMAIAAIRFMPPQELMSYTDLVSEYDAKQYPEITGNKFILIQAENSRRKSEPTIYPIFDRTSSLTQPFDFNAIRLNTIGASNWRFTGEWISWTISIPDDWDNGLYKIVLRYRNNLVNGQIVYRRLYIDGQIPFSEANSLSFGYSPNWQIDALRESENEFKFYFEAGKSYELKLEASLGEFAEILRSVRSSVERLNYVYRQILMITGSSPDPNRDYDIDLALPESMLILEEELAELYRIRDRIIEISGIGGNYLSAINMMCVRIENMLKYPENIPKKFADFKNCIVALGAWMLSAEEQPLEIDTISIASCDYEFPDPEEGFFGKLWTGLRLFAASFINDYNSIGNLSNKVDSISVWLASGRDQATIVRSLVSNYFEPSSQSDVNVRLVAAGALLPAVLSGNGPDVYLSVAASEPVNYALRGAVRSLNEFEGLDKVLGRFHESAIEPFIYNGNMYGLPETQTFPMLFYREDILSELSLPVPDTWEDVYDMLPALSNKHMFFGLPASSVANPNLLDLSVYWTFILQNGGRIYNEEKTAILIDNETGLDMFKKWTDFYTNYGLEYTYDFATRFRLGEIAIGIADYSMYNVLSVFAPEISGLWSFTSVPGTKHDNGKTDRSVAGNSTATIMMKASRNPEASWSFMDWWSEADTQVKYGRELESILGTAARYPVANLEALEMMPWSTKNLNELKKQWESVKGIPELPGSYLTNREINFAFRAVVVSGEDPREALLDHVVNINNEIAKKRKEFLLP
jgi:ABC-type glycerol-3-phosphate transport system substrate-binding protein